MKIEDIKRDREAGTPGAWDAEGLAEHSLPNERPWVGIIEESRYAALSCGETQQEAVANARRIARVPELEAALLEAVDLLSEVAEGMNMATHDDVLEFLERFK